MKTRSILAAAALALLSTAALAQTPDEIVQQMRAAARAGDFRGAALLGGQHAEAVAREGERRRAEAQHRNFEALKARQDQEDARDREAARQQAEIDRHNDEARKALQAQEAERNRQAIETARIDAELRRQQAEAAQAKQAIEDAKPINRLFRGYQYFGHARFCHESRDGYLMVYVNDFEMEKAETAIKVLAEQSIKADPSIDTDKLWAEALKALEGAPAEQIPCHNSLLRLFNLVPSAVYSNSKPGGK
jgi:hypothetical protein